MGMIVHAPCASMSSPLPVVSLAPGPRGPALAFFCAKQIQWHSQTVQWQIHPYYQYLKVSFTPTNPMVWPAACHINPLVRIGDTGKAYPPAQIFEVSTAHALAPRPLHPRTFWTLRILILSWRSGGGSRTRLGWAQGRTGCRILGVTPGLSQGG